MTPQRYQQVRSVFLSVRELPVSERAARLADECGDDAELRAEVEAMVIDAAAARSFLQDPPIDSEPKPNNISADAFTPRVQAGHGQAKNDSAHGASPEVEAGRDFLDGYELLEKISRGGQGVV